MQNQRQYRKFICGGILISSMLFPSATASAAPAITATAASGAMQLALDDTGGNPIIQKVADLQISTAASNGLTLSVQPSSLTKTDGNPIALQFTVVSDGASAPNAAAFTTDSSTVYNFVTNTASTDNLDLYIKYTPASLQDPGSYASNIQMSVADNP